VANRKITELTALTTPAADDVIPIVDISETSNATKNKKITVANLIENFADVDLKLANGTESAPSLAFTNSVSTGLYRSAANELSITTNGGRAIKVESNNKTTIYGDLVVTGGTTTISSTTIDVADKNIQLATGNSSDTGADGGGLTLKGETDKTWNWVDSTDAWTANQHIDVASGKVYKIAGATVLNATTLGSAVVNSSLTSVGTLGSLTVTNAVTAGSLDISGGVDIDGTLEADAYTVNGTALNEYIADTVGAMVSSNTETDITVTYDDNDNTLDFVIGTLNQDTTGNAATATALETARTIGGVSFNGTANINLPGVNQTGNQNTTGSAATLTTARTIGGVSFDGSANINLPGVNAAGNQNTSGTAAGLSGTPNITVGVVTGGSLDISGDADIDGTLEADAYTVNGTALNEYIADTVGAMVSSNTETNIAVTYDDNDNTLDFVISSYPAASISGTTLASNVVTSSLTSVGTLGSLNVTNTVTANLFSGSGASLTSLPAAQLSGAIANGVTATTQSANDNSTKVATTAYTDTAISNLVDSSPSALNTLNELAAALGDDANFSTTVTNSIATKLPLAGGTLTGNVIYNDDVKASFGTGSDLHIYHDGTDNYWQTGAVTTHFRVDNGNRLTLKSDGNVQMQGSSGKNLEWVTASGSLTFADSAKATFGTGNDLSIYHDGSDSWVKNNTGALIIRGSGGTSLMHLEPKTDENGILVKSDGEVSLWYDNSKKLETSSAGISVTGQISQFETGGNNKFITKRTGAAGSNNDVFFELRSLNTADQEVGSFLFQRESAADDSYFILKTRNTGGSNTERLRITSAGNVQIPADNKKLQIGASQDFEVYHDGGSTHLDNNTGHFFIRNNVNDDDGGNIYIQGKSQENSIICNDDGAVELYYDNSLQFKTTANGCQIDGDLYFDNEVNAGRDLFWDQSADYLKFSDNVQAVFGNGTDLQIWHDGGGHNYIRGTDSTRNYIQHGTDKAIVTYPNGTVELYYDNVKYLSTDAGGVRFAGWGAFADNGKAYFGTGNDLHIYHDGSHSYIDNTNGTGNLYLQDEVVRVRAATSFAVDNTDGTETALIATLDGAVDLYYDNSKKLETVSGGINVIGSVTDDGANHDGDVNFYGVSSYNAQWDKSDASLKFLDNAKIKIGTGDDLQIYHDGSNSYVAETGTGDLVLQGGTVWIQHGNGENALKATEDAGVELRYNNVKKFETTSSGVTVTGSINATGQVKINDSYAYIAGTGNDLQIYHDGGNSFIKDTGTGRLSICTSQLQLTNAADSEVMIKATEDGAVELYHNNNKKLETSTYGTTLTGNLFLADSSDTNWGRIKLGTAEDLQIYHDGSNSYINDVGTGGIKILTSGLQVKNAADDSYMAFFGSTGTTELYYDGSKKLETTSGGATVTGTLTATAFSGDGSNITGITSTPGSNQDIDLDDNKKFICGNGDDLQIYHDGTNSQVRNSTGSLLVMSDTYHVKSMSPNEDMIKGVANGAVELYYNGHKSFNTGSTGISVYGPEGGNGSINLYADEGDDNADFWRLQSGTDGVWSLDNFAAGSYENSIKATGNGNVELYYDNSKKLETTSGGVTVTGTLIATANIEASNNIQLLDDKKLLVGNGNDLQIYHDGSTNIINGVSGNTSIRTAAAGTSGENAILIVPNGAVSLYYDDTKRFETTSSGVTVTGYLGVDELGLGDNEKAKFGNGEDLQIWHDGSNSYLWNGTNSLIVRTGGFSINDAANAKNSATFDTDGAVELYYDNAKTFTTSANAGIVWGTEGNNATLFFHADEGDDWADYWNLTATTTAEFKLQCRADGGGFETSIESNRNGNVELYYDNAKHFETTSTGVSWGTTRLRCADNGMIEFGTGQDLQIYHDGSHSYIYNQTNELKNRAAIWKVVNEANSEIQIKATENAAVELYYDHTKRFETGPGYNLSTGDISPSASGTYNLGGTNAKWNNAYFAGDVYLYDNDKLLLGDGADLQIYHDATNNWIKSATGQLKLETVDSVQLFGNNGETLAQFSKDGACYFYYNNSQKLATAAGGVRVTGNLLLDADSQYIKLGASDDLQIYHDGSNSYLKAVSGGTGNLYIFADGKTIFLRPKSGEDGIKVIPDGAVELYYDNSKHFETNSGGVKVNDNLYLGCGNGNDLQISHNATDSTILNQTGNLRVRTTGTLYLQVNGGSNENAVTATSNGAVELYYDNVKKLETSSTGIWCSGYLSGEGLDIADNKKLLLGSGDDLEIYHDGSDSYIDNSTGALYLKSPYFIDLRSDGNETMIKGIKDAGVELYYNNSKKFETLNGGAKVHGQFYCTSEVNLTGQGNKYIDTAHLNHALRFRRISDGDTGHSDHCTVSSAGLWSADFNDVSDEKLKENIVAIADGAISKIKQLRPVNFDWKATDKAKNVSGFIAQELKTVLPNLVYGTEYDPTIIDQSQGVKSTGYSVNTIGIVANLTKALQEAITKIETLETKVAALESA